IILTGISLGAYGRDLPSPTDLLGLLQKIEQYTDIERLRLSSLNPTDISDEMIDHLQGSKMLCRHLHLSLQSGDDRILGLMRRDYTPGRVSDLVTRLQTAIPEIAIGMDVITGFPGEGEEAFQNTAHFLENIRLAYLHVFPYSRRPGTTASSLPDQVMKSVSKERAALLRDIGNRKRVAFNSGFTGETLSVLVEGTGDKETGWVKGFSDNYVPVLIPEGDLSLANQIVPVMAERMMKEKVVGRIVTDG
ncbi:MAG: radical SAM protein, partial [Deltaproteobacteria bacterium]|nr:radical SAM protein [Deltaproteobacteria bacterium]